MDRAIVLQRRGAPAPTRSACVIIRSTPMAEKKTQKNDASVADFLNGIADEQVRADCWKVSEMMQTATGAEPKMWGHAIIGYGSREMAYSNGKKYDWMVIGFSPRKQDITMYVLDGSEKMASLLAKLGKHKAHGGCLHVKKLADVDTDALKSVIEYSAAAKRIPRVP